MKIDPLLSVNSAAGPSCTLKSSPFTLMPRKVLSKCSFRDRPERPRKFPAPGVGEEDVDPALLPLHDVVHVVEVGEVRDVAPNSHNIRPDTLGGGVQLSLAASGDEYVRAFRDEPLGRRQADAGTTARDDRDLAFELPGHDASPSASRAGSCRGS